LQKTASDASWGRNLALFNEQDRTVGESKAGAVDYSASGFEPVGLLASFFPSSFGLNRCYVLVG